MKKIITYSLVLCLSSILVFSSVSKAAALTPTVQAPSNVFLNLTNSYYAGLDSTDNPIGDYYYATYEGDMTISIDTTNADGYMSGYVIVLGGVNVDLPSGYSNSSVNIGVNEYDLKSYINITGASSFSGYMYFDNEFDSRYRTLCVLHITVSLRFSYTGSNTPDPPSRIVAHYNDRGITSQLSTSPEPEDQGIVHIISSAINNGDFSGHVEDIVDLLNLVKDNNATYYTNILRALNTSNTWLNEIFTTLDGWDTIEIPNIIQKLEIIISDLVVLDTNNVYWLRLIREYVYDIYSKLNDGNAAAATANQGADTVESQAAAINGAVNKPNVDNLISEIDTRMSPAVYNGMTYLLAFINRPYFITILMLVFSLAFCGYLFYGKGV